MNTFYHGDCLFVMRHDIQPESVDLIYLDPPFFTGKKQRGTAKWQPEVMEISYEDSKRFWGDTEKVKAMREKAPIWLQDIASNHPDFASYLYYMMVRLKACHDVLSKTGSIYLHCNWRASHYLKMIMDKIFGDRNFQNEIVWHYKGRGMQKQRFQRKHDIIFYFSKNKGHIFNTKDILVPLDKQHIGRYNKIDAEGQKYALIKGHDGKYSKIYRKDGIIPDDTWDIPFIHGSEATGYPTQKPLVLLKRIILTSSNEGDVVLDPFCGCGTAILASQELKRQWIGIDINKAAYDTTKDRELQLPLGIREEFAKARYVSRDLTEAKAMKPKEFEEWANEFYKAAKPHPDLGVDGITQDGIPIQSKAYIIKYDKLGQFVEDARHHPKVPQPLKKVVMVSQIGFDESATKRKFKVETREGIEVHLTTPEEMLKLEP